MKPLSQFTESVIVRQTPRQKLINALLERYKEIRNTPCVEAFCDILNEELSKCSIAESNLSSAITELPKGLLGKTVTINYYPKDSTPQVLKGDVIEVLYRDTAYPMCDIIKLLENKDTSEEQKSMLRMTAFTETKPKIYHRIVLNEETQGILIVPYVKGVTIEQEG